MSSTLRKLAIKDPESDDMVILTNIREGVDGAVDMGWTQEAESVRVDDNQTMDHSLNGELDIKVLRLSGSALATLQGLVGKRVELAGWTIEGFLLFRGTHYLNRHQDFNSDILNDRIHVTVKTVKGYLEE